MVLQDVLAYQKTRIRKAWIYGPILGFGGALFISNLLLKPTWETLAPGPLWGTLLVSFSVPTLYLWLSPAPWLWTGNRATHAPLVRGALQATAFNVAFLACSIGLGLFLTRKLPSFQPDSSRLAVGVVGTALHGAAAALVGYFISLWERTRIVKEETEKKLREAHWVLLRGQLSPHALFNALNGLAELVRVDAAAAEQVILDLADLYRALLDHGSKPQTPLSEEKRLVTRYLAVEHMRLGGRLRVEWHWDEALEKLETPPFLIQPLVENALKHGISPNPEGGDLGIGLTQVEDCLVLWVSNSGRPLPLVLGSGVGVSNLEARLYLAFGSGAHFALRGEGERTRAEIGIPLRLLQRPGSEFKDGNSATHPHSLSRRNP